MEFSSSTSTASLFSLPTPYIPIITVNKHRSRLNPDNFCIVVIFGITTPFFACVTSTHSVKKSLHHVLNYVPTGAALSTLRAGNPQEYCVRTQYCNYPQGARQTLPHPARQPQPRASGRADADVRTFKAAFAAVARSWESTIFQNYTWNRFFSLLRIIPSSSSMRRAAC